MEFAVINTPKVTNLDKFNALIAKFDLPISNEIKVGATDYLDNPIAGKTFAGIDSRGRAFINVSVVGHVVSCGTVDVEAGDRFAFTVFQRYENSENIFVVGRNLFPMTQDNFLLTPSGDDYDFSKLEKLLAGETLRFHNTTKWNGSSFAEDPNNYIELRLNKPK